MKALFAEALKNIWNGWRPDWLADETRRPAAYGDYDNPEQWIGDLPASGSSYLCWGESVGWMVSRYSEAGVGDLVTKEQDGPG